MGMSQVSVLVRSEPGEGATSSAVGAAATLCSSPGMTIAAEIATKERAADASTMAMRALAPTLFHHQQAMTMSKLTFKPYGQMARALTGLLLGLLITQTVLAQTQRPEPPPIEERRYEDSHTFKYGKAFSKDPWTWGYTKEFAQRFHMPDKWIEPEMKGILAIAFRVTDVGQSVHCGLGGREDNCWPSVICQFDIYYDNSIQLPWVKEAVTRDSFLTIPISSASYTHDAYGRIMERYKTERGGPKPLLIGFSNDKGFSRQFAANILYYDREFASGVGLVSIEHGTCAYPFRKEGRWLDFFANKEIQEMSKDLPRNQLTRVGLIHEALVPESFMQRAEAARQRDTQEQEQINKRLIREFQQRQPGNVQSK